MLNNTCQQNMYIPLDQEEFPTLESVKNIPFRSRHRETDVISSTFTQVSKTKFIVSSSIIEARKASNKSVDTAAVSSFDNKYTRMCKSFEQGNICSYGTRCQFAHSFEQLSCRDCSFGDRCCFIHVSTSGRVSNQYEADRICSFKHPSESKEQFFQRITGKSIDTPNSSEFVIELDDDDCSLPAEENENENEKEIVIKIPQALAHLAFESILASGKTNVRIVIIDT
jgi:hypothetical protein